MKTKQLSLTLFLSLTFTLFSNLSMAKTICVAHRGNNAEFLENSMAAIKSAAQLGTPGIEFDIHHTKDGVPILMHDKDLKRLTKDDGICPRSKKVNALTFREIRSKCLLTNDEPVPSLADALRYLSKTSSAAYVELKDKPREQTVQVLKKYYATMPNKLVLISFKENYLAYMQGQKNKYPFLKKVKLLLVAKKSKKSISSYLDGIDVKKLKKKHLKRLRKAGKIIGVWTKNSEKSITYYKDLKIDFVTTNEVRRCLSL